MSSKSSNKGAKNSSKAPRKAPKQVETTNDVTGAPLAPETAPVVVTDNVTAALVALEQTSNEQSAPKAPETGAPTSYVLAPPGAAMNVLGGRLGASTHALDTALCEAARGATDSDLKLLSAKALHARHVALCEAMHCAPRAASATAPHVTRWRDRRYVVRVNGAYALSNRGRKLVQLAPLSSLTTIETTMYGAPTDAS